MLPLALDLSHRAVLVIGMGRVGQYKTRQLLEAGAHVDVISDVLVCDVPEGVRSVRVRPYRAGDLDGYYLVVSATANPTANDQIVTEARERQIFVNVVDDPPRCSFYFTSLYRDGDVIISVSSSGASPSLAQWIRRRVQEILPAGLGQVAQTLRAERAALHAAGESTERDWSQRVRELTNPLTSEIQPLSHPRPIT